MRTRIMFLFIITMACLNLSSCKKKEEVPEKVWEQAVIVPNKQKTTADAYPLLNDLKANKIESVKVLTYDENLEPVYTELEFTDHGLLNGKDYLLVPLTEQSGSVFNMFGIITAIDITGRHAELTRGQKTLDFSESMITMFVNKEDSVYLSDMPLFYMGTLYVPLEPILKEFDIPWVVEEQVIIIGG